MSFSVLNQPIEILETSDGSHTLYLPDQKETYHNKNGAVTESMHVFIKNGLKSLARKEVRILEMGFGTGLNAYITLLESLQDERKIKYTSLEKYPLNPEILAKINHSEALKNHYPAVYHRDDFNEIHKRFGESHWGEKNSISDTFELLKREEDFSVINLSESTFDLIYYDAFGPRVQPDLWTKEILAKCFHFLSPEGVFVTYCSKGEVRRSLMALGFECERLPGPPGKREMLRATKPKAL